MCFFLVGRHDSDIVPENSDATMATSALNLKTSDSQPAATALIATSDEPKKSPKHYRGFVAGVFSGIAKLSGKLFLSSICVNMTNKTQWATPSTR